MTLIEKIMVAVGFVSMAVAVLTLYFAWCNEHKFHPMREVLEKFRRLPLGAQVVLTIFASVFFVYGSTKTNTPPNGVEGGIERAAGCHHRR